MHGCKVGAALVVVVSKLNLIGADCLHPMAPDRETTRSYTPRQFCKLRPEQRLPLSPFMFLSRGNTVHEDGGLSVMPAPPSHIPMFIQISEVGRCRPVLSRDVRTSCLSSNTKRPLLHNSSSSKQHPHRTAVWRGLRVSFSCCSLPNADVRFARMVLTGMLPAPSPEIIAGSTIADNEATR